MVRLWQKRDTGMLFMGRSFDIAVMENSTQEVPQILDIELLYEPAIIPLCIYPKEQKSGT